MYRKIFGIILITIIIFSTSACNNDKKSGKTSTFNSDIDPKYKNEKLPLNVWNSVLLKFSSDSKTYPELVQKDEYIYIPYNDTLYELSSEDFNIKTSYKMPILANSILSVGDKLYISNTNHINIIFDTKTKKFSEDTSENFDNPKYMNIYNFGYFEENLVFSRSDSVISDFVLEIRDKNNDDKIIKTIAKDINFFKKFKNGEGIYQVYDMFCANGKLYFHVAEDKKDSIYIYDIQSSKGKKFISADSINQLYVDNTYLYFVGNTKEEHDGTKNMIRFCRYNLRTGKLDKKLYDTWKVDSGIGLNYFIYNNQIYFFDSKDTDQNEFSELKKLSLKTYNISKCNLKGNLVDVGGGGQFLPSISEDSILYTSQNDGYVKYNFVKDTIETFNLKTN